MAEPRGEEGPVPGPSGLGQRKGLAAPREEPRSPGQMAREIVGWNRSRRASNQGSPAEGTAGRRTVEERGLVPPHPAAITAVAGVQEGCN